MKKILILLFLFSTVCIGSTKQEITVFSTAMNKQIKNTIILPDGYTKNAQNYPVIYVLHGAGGNHTNWPTKAPNIMKLADTYNCIIVCPDGSPNSWYFNSLHDVGSQYETYISKELVNYIDSNYKTRANKNGRAITGLSMGGHGAFYLAFKNQDIFGAAGSMSGGVNIIPFHNNWGIAKHLGVYNANTKQIWQNHSVNHMLHLVENSSQPLIFDCGIDDFFYEINKQLHQNMLEKNISHTYIERPGAHNWQYWNKAIPYHFQFFTEFFNK